MTRAAATGPASPASSAPESWTAWSPTPTCATCSPASQTATSTRTLTPWWRGPTRRRRAKPHNEHIREVPAEFIVSPTDRYSTRRIQSPCPRTQHQIQGGVDGTYGNRRRCLGYRRVSAGICLPWRASANGERPPQRASRARAGRRWPLAHPLHRARSWHGRSKPRTGPSFASRTRGAASSASSPGAAGSDAASPRARNRSGCRRARR